MPIARCTEVVDGDTLIADREWIRLEGVNAPERGQPGWERAKQALERLVLNKTIRYEGKARDTFGRLLAHVWVDNTNINQAMKKLGY